MWFKYTNLFLKHKYCIGIFQLTLMLMRENIGTEQITVMGKHVSFLQYPKVRWHSCMARI